MNRTRQQQSGREQVARHLTALAHARDQDLEECGGCPGRPLAPEPGGDVPHCCTATDNGPDA